MLVERASTSGHNSLIRARRRVPSQGQTSSVNHSRCDRTATHHVHAVLWPRLLSSMLILPTPVRVRRRLMTSSSVIRTSRKAAVLPFRYIHMVGPAGIEPASRPFRSLANPSQLETHESGSRDSNPVLLVPNQGRLPLHHIPVGLDGLEPPASCSPSMRATYCATTRGVGTPGVEPGFS
jgi:hypothetical protein